MSFESKLNELYTMSGDLNLNEGQREAATNAFNSMIDQHIRDAIARIAGRTQELNDLTDQLQSIIDSIHANQLDGLVNKANELATAANNAANND